MTTRSGDRIGLRRARGERGASAVEFAIIAPLFFMITFGMITGGIAYNQKHSLTHAAREGARYGATLVVEQFDATCPGTSGACWANSVRDVTVDRAFGELNSTVPGRRICVALVEGDPGTIVTLNGSAYWSDTAGGTAARCFDDNGADGARRVQVLVERDGELNAILFQMALNLSSEASARHEQPAS